MDAISYEFVRGSTIDYAEEMIKSSFEVVKNPQADDDVRVRGVVRGEGRGVRGVTRVGGRRGRGPRRSEARRRRARARRREARGA